MYYTFKQTLKILKIIQVKAKSQNKNSTVDFEGNLKLKKQ